MDGILLVDKPAGWTSHDVVAKIRAIIRAKTGQKVKVGHAGTLDPMATGLLIILIGGYTKRANQYLKLDKSYECELTLGAVSTTGDADGKITPLRVVPYRSKNRRWHKKITPTKDKVEKVLEQFKGQMKQVPPAYSAIKIRGQEAYKLARAGKTPWLAPRQVTVYRLQVTEYKYPKIKLMAEVSSGTYIRSLAQDIGARLGTGAYLSSLRRTKVGNFDIKDAIKIEELNLSKLL